VGLSGTDGAGLARIDPPTTFRVLGLSATPQCLVFHGEDVLLFDSAAGELLCVSHLSLTAGASPSPPRCPLGDQCLDIALSERAGLVLLGLRESRRLLAVDADVLHRLARSGDRVAVAAAAGRTFELGGRPCGLAVDHLGRRAFVSLLEGGVARVHLRDRSVRNIPLGVRAPGARWMGMAPRDDYLYVPNHADGTVSVIDVSAEKAVDRLRVGDGPSDVAVTVDYKVYVANAGNGTVSVIE
jgi:YVTN family beta-propeller protein